MTPIARLDTDGYPAEESLEAIEKWEVIGSPLTEFLEYCQSLWSYPERWVQEEDSLYLSTGGWSGNESVVGSMKRNFIFWAMCWEESRRGGHYKFDLTRWTPAFEEVQDD